MSKCCGFGPPRKHEPITDKRVGRYRELWRQLHSYHTLVKQWNVLEAMIWLERWEECLPPNCPCREHWKEAKLAVPPDFSSPENFYQWTIQIHNYVNEQLGKPIWTPE